MKIYIPIRDYVKFIRKILRSDWLAGGYHTIKLKVYTLLQNKMVSTGSTNISGKDTSIRVYKDVGCFGSGLKFVFYAIVQLNVQILQLLFSLTMTSNKYLNVWREII